MDRTFEWIPEISGNNLTELKPLFTANAQNHWLQDPSLFAQPSANTRLAVTRENGEAVAYAFMELKRVLPLGPKVLLVDRGPVFRNLTDLEYLVQQLVSQLKKESWLIELSPYCYEPCCGHVVRALQGLNFYQGQSQRAHYSQTLTLDLTVSTEEIKQQFRRSLKTQLNKFAKSNIRSEYSQNADDLASFLAMHNRMAENRQLKVISKKQHEWLKNQLGDLAHLFIATEDDQVLGGILLVAHPTKTHLTYEFGVKAERVTQPVSHGLHWQAIQWAKEAGFKQYDFGGYNSEHAGNSINQFKLGFTKTVQSVTPELRWAPSGWVRFLMEHYLAWRA